MAYLRRLPRFEYLAPRTNDEACDLLAAHGTEARVLAGGTDLLLQMRRRETVPKYVIGLKGVEDLAYVREQPDGTLAIGAMTAIQTVMTSPLVRKQYGILAEVAGGIGGPELRNVATIGGNLAGALPCADFPPALIALGAKVKLKSRQGERSVAVEDMFPRFGTTVARADELLTDIQLPRVPPLSGGTYLKFHERQSMDLTTIGVSAVVTWDQVNRVFHDVKIGLASSAPIPMRARKTEATLRGRACTDDTLEAAAVAVCEEADPRSSWRATREFRFELLRGLIKRAIRIARERAVPMIGETS